MGYYAYMGGLASSPERICVVLMKHECTDAGTIVPCSAASEQPITEPLIPISPLHEVEEICFALPLDQIEERGREAGRTDARQTLDQAQQRQDEALTRQDILAAFHALFTVRLKESSATNEQAKPWYNGWFQGYTDIMIQAKKAAPLPSVPLVEQLGQDEAFVIEGTVTFRKASIQTDDMKELTVGIECGQASFVDDHRPITSRLLLEFFESVVGADDPEAYDVGFILGFIDALLHNRKTYPPTYLKAIAVNTAKA